MLRRRRIGLISRHHKPPEGTSSQNYVLVDQLHCGVSVSPLWYTGIAVVLHLLEKTQAQPFASLTKGFLRDVSNFTVISSSFSSEPSSSSFRTL